MKTIVSASLAGATLLGVAGSVAADTAVPTVPTYTATYEAEYKGKSMGSSEFKVTHKRHLRARRRSGRGRCTRTGTRR